MFSYDQNNVKWFGFDLGLKEVKLRVIFRCRRVFSLSAIIAVDELVAAAMDGNRCGCVVTAAIGLVAVTTAHREQKPFVLCFTTAVAEFSFSHEFDSLFSSFCMLKPLGFLPEVLRTYFLFPKLRFKIE